MSRPDRQSAGILDDYAVRKNVDTKEGTIQKTPLNDYDIVNKKYVDDAIAAINVDYDYGAMYGDDGIFSFSTGGALTEIQANFHAGELHNITFPNVYYLQVAKAGKYLCNYSVSVAPADNGLQARLISAVMINGVVAGSGWGTTGDGWSEETTPYTGGQEFRNLSANAILDLAIGDIVSLAVASQNGLNTYAYVEYASLTLKEI